VVAWGILESIWDLFEAATEGLTEAGSMRLAFHLGRGDVHTSKLSCWKTQFLSTLLACTLSIGFLILSPYVPRWYTNDETLIEMVQTQLPLIGIGNIFMVFGMTSWSLIGAQGRYRIATVISATMTFCVTLPLAAFFCIGMRYSLISLVGAVVIGYSTTGLLLGFLLQMSDWDHISKNICALNENEELDSRSEVDSVEDCDEFQDNVSTHSTIVEMQKSPDGDSNYSSYDIILESLKSSQEERLRLANYLENVKEELLVLARKNSTQVTNGFQRNSGDEVTLLTARIVDLEAQVLEKDSIIENLKGDIQRIQQLYGAELSDLLGRIKNRVRQTSEVLLSNTSSRDLSSTSSAEQNS